MTSNCALGEVSLIPTLCVECAIAIATVLLSEPSSIPKKLEGMLELVELPPPTPALQVYEPPLSYLIVPPLVLLPPTLSFLHLHLNHLNEVNV